MHLHPRRPAAAKSSSRSGSKPATPAATLARLVESVLARWRRSPGLAAIGIASFGPLDLDPASPLFGSIVSTPKPGWSGADLLSPVRAPRSADTARHRRQRRRAGRGTLGRGAGAGRASPTSLSEPGRRRIDHPGPDPFAAAAIARRAMSGVPRLPGDDWPGFCPFHGDCVEGLASGAAIARPPRAGRDRRKDWDGWATVEHALAMLLHNLVAHRPAAADPDRRRGDRRAIADLIARVSARLLASLAGYYTAAGDRRRPGLPPRARRSGPGRTARAPSRWPRSAEARSANRNSRSAQSPTFQIGQRSPNLIPGPETGRDRFWRGSHAL